MPRFFSILFLVSLSIPTYSLAQTLDDIKARLEVSYKRIWKFYKSTEAGSSDSLMNENIRLKDYLLATLPKVPESLTAYFPKNEFAGKMDVVTSPDKKFRQWSWNTLMGGTMPWLWQIYQYQTSDGIKVFCSEDVDINNLSNDSFDTIFSVVGISGVTYYLPVIGWMGDTRNAGRTLIAFIIKDSTLVFGVELFKTKKGFVNKIPISYSSQDEAITWDYVQKHSFRLENNGRTLLVPLINKHYKMTSKHLQYDFDGEYFVYKGVKK